MRVVCNSTFPILYGNQFLYLDAGQNVVDGADFLLYLGADVTETTAPLSTPDRPADEDSVEVWRTYAKAKDTSRWSGCDQGCQQGHPHLHLRVGAWRRAWHTPLGMGTGVAAGHVVDHSMIDITCSHSH